MKIINKKGGAIVVAIVITLVMVIMASSLYPIITNNRNSIEHSIDRTRLYYLAEFGMQRNIIWLKNIGLSNFLSKDSSVTIASGYNKNLPYENMTLSVSAKAVTPAGAKRPKWTLISTATDGKTSCTMTLDDVYPDSPLKYCFFSSAKGDMGGAFTAIQNFYGKTYFNGELAFLLRKESSKPYGYKGPTFWDEVDSSDPTDSKLLGFSLPDYAKGLDIWNNTITDPNLLLNVLNTEVFPAGYNHSVAEQPTRTMTQSWTELQGRIDTYKVPASSKDVYLNFVGGKIIVSTDSFTTSTNESLPYVLKVINQNSSTRIVTYDSADDKPLHIKGEVTSDISVATKDEEVRIEGDFYSSGFAGYKNDNNGLYGGYASDNATHPINEMRNIDDNIRVGLIVGLEASKADVIIPKAAGTDTGSIILLTAGVYVPNGYLKGEKPKEWSHYTRLILNGSLIGKGEGLTENGGKGFGPNYINDWAFLNGDRAPGFKSSKEINPVNGEYQIKFADRAQWSIAWN